MDIDIHGIDKTYIDIKKRIADSDISANNRTTLNDFAEDCLLGWKIRRVSKTRTSTLLTRLLVLTRELKKEWIHFDERDSKKLLLWMDEKYPLPDHDWSQHSYRIVLRKFVTWLRQDIQGRACEVYHFSCVPAPLAGSASLQKRPGSTRMDRHHQTPGASGSKL